ncbi:hypothetical protein [Mycolicibacterium sp.]|nr:hypothetical protein [Mycolicibacterium sp.]
MVAAASQPLATAPPPHPVVIREACTAPRQALVSYRGNWPLGAP